MIQPDLPTIEEVEAHTACIRERLALPFDPSMIDELGVTHSGQRLERILASFEVGRPVRVPLVEGQSARGLRTAISRAASSRGMTVETIEGDGFVAVRKADASGPQRGKLAPSGGGQRRRGRPPKLQA